ncbi:hypothetical protein FSP39_016901 [Pinctada imbricata]|uniref:EF-hand domain-containing protein n=1 Tax=Pinctada imbricata TaxID=66713 RepID=A0AA88YFG3_PINIB|nr:hypothetical protein FSP39_016901 [Pinctada imbricata]
MNLIKGRISSPVYQALSNHYVPMKIAWILLVSLFCLYLVSEVESWRRIRLRLRRIGPRIRLRRIVRTVRVSRVFRIPRVRLRRLPGLGTLIGVPILDKVIKLPKIRFRLSRIFRKRKNNPPPDLPPALPPPGPEPGPEPEPTLPTCPEICAGNCPEKCTSWNCPCQWVCPTTCEIFSKEEFLWPYKGFPAPLPCDFHQYDADNNTLISPSELAYQVRRRARDVNNMMVFNKMDVDRDGNLTQDEFDSLLLLKDCEDQTTG